jgi:hypothetical protein
VVGGWNSRRVRILVVGGESWAATQARSALASAHDVLRCHDDGQPGFPCRRFTGGACPVDEGVDVVAVVRDRPSADVAMTELGAVCGLRAGLPLVEAGFTEGSPFQSVRTATVPAGSDLVAVCESVAIVDVRSVDPAPDVVVEQR